MTPLESGLAAFATGDYHQARQLLHPLAQAGNAEAMSIIGNLAQLGLGEAVDLPAAVYWYERSALQGHGLAANNLAGLLLTGYGNVSPDPIAAQTWFSRARAMGFTHAPETPAAVQG